MDQLFEEMMVVLKDRRRRLFLRIPQSEYGLVAEAIREGTVYSQAYEENDVLIDVELPLIHAQQLTAYIAPAGEPQ